MSFPGGQVPGSSEWEERWSAYRSLRAPFDSVVTELQGGEGGSLNLAIRFLEERPRFLQSGYIAERMLHYLDRPDWDPRERSRVVQVARAIVRVGNAREAREARKLLSRLGESQEES